jgi:twitching motility protein PilT
MLSFSSELKISLPEFMMGTSRFQAMNKLLTVNSEWKKEAFLRMKDLLMSMHDFKASFTAM